MASSLSRGHERVGREMIGKHGMGLVRIKCHEISGAGQKIIHCRYETGQSQKLYYYGIITVIILGCAKPKISLCFEIS